MTEDDWIDLCRTHMPVLYRAISRRVGLDRELAEDVTQEAWLRAIDSWRRTGVAERMRSMARSEYLTGAIAPGCPVARVAALGSRVRPSRACRIGPHGARPTP